MQEKKYQIRDLYTNSTPSCIASQPLPERLIFFDSCELCRLDMHQCRFRSFPGLWSPSSVIPLRTLFASVRNVNYNFSFPLHPATISHKSCLDMKKQWIKKVLPKNTFPVPRRESYRLGHEEIMDQEGTSKEYIPCATKRKSPNRKCVFSRFELVIQSTQAHVPCLRLIGQTLVETTPCQNM